MTPILAHLITDAGDSVLGIEPKDLDKVLDQAADAIPEAVVGIFEYWRSAP